MGEDVESLKAVAIYGAGGFAREVAWLLTKLESYKHLGFIDDSGEDGRILHGKPVMSWHSFIYSKTNAVVAVAVGNPQARAKIVEKCSAAGISFATLVHHSVEMSASVELGVGAIVCGGSILTVDIHVANHVHINLDCTVGHDARIGEFSTLSPGVHVSGNVHIGRNVYVGTGASIINGTSEHPLVISDGTVIGAGACITKSTEGNCLYAGVPAQLKRRYT